MRTQNVIVANKTVIVEERKVSELKSLYNKNRSEIDKMMKANNLADGENAVNSLLYDKLTEIFPVLTNEDIDNAYPSELEELIGAFVEVNFTGVKKVAAPLLKIILQGLAK